MGKFPRHEDYLPWLIDQINFPNDSFHKLCELLHEKEFVWFIPNDDNRLHDGLAIRKEFFQKQLNLGKGCSILELIVALSRRCSDNSFDIEPEDWAWDLLVNLQLDRFSGQIFPGKMRAQEVDEILERLIWRTYEPDGRGGFFPLKQPKKDQREVEIWYQMSAYIIESWDIPIS